ncbi:flagellar protein FlgJ [Desulfomicrobium norvegicum]|uniref:Flagellar protein FlgJ n=1 Tax=Desulfomicrobium norvegicum (strain DSM 1741 / NCIMB 8310) TaxID=52561 RepID=A0A8G2C0B1_DESNO|nr:rod-binding protein [Desulfomicrobium norvegicum]SFL32461.1 flagellar protein FlgJ [Desulfomicrobium norvegicum]
MNEIITTGLPEPDPTQSLQERLRDLRSRVQPEKGLDEVKLKKACQDFEAVFIGQIWKQMRASVPKEGLLHSKEEESYLSMFDQELSVKMSQSGGIGLSDMLYANLSERLVNASRDTTSTAPLHPLNVADRGKAPSGTQAAAVPPRTLAAITAQHEAEMLARSIEQRSQSGEAQTKIMPTDLEDALRVVRMDGEDGP